jgi:hypothetical protein
MKWWGDRVNPFKPNIWLLSWTLNIIAMACLPSTVLATFAGECNYAGGNIDPGPDGNDPVCILQAKDGPLTLKNFADLKAYIDANQPTDSTSTKSIEPQSGSPVAPETSPSTDSSDPCAALAQQVESCKTTSQDAADSTCNTQANGQMTSVIGMAKAMTNQMSMQSAANIQAACSQMGELATKANEALLAFESYCQVAQSDCTTACQQADAMVKAYPNCPSQSSEIAAAKRSCAKAGNALAQAGTQMQGIMAQKMNAQTCANSTNAMSQFCQANPGNIMCSTASSNVNCSDPAVASSNTVCICSSNPRDPRCSAAGLASAGVNSAAAGVGSAGSNAANNAALAKLAAGSPDLTLSGGDSGFGIPSGAMGGAGGPGAGGPRGAGRNINGGGEAPHTAGNKHPAGGGGNNSLNTKVNGGYYGGGGGGGGSFGSGSSGSGAGGPQGYGGGLPPGSQMQGKVDLRQFLPGGKRDPARGLAGISGPDGITGPNSDLWQKVNTRYQAVTWSLRH